MKRIIFLALSISLFSMNANATNPEIAQIKRLYSIIEKKSKTGAYIHKRKDIEYIPVKMAKIYFEKKRGRLIPRKLHCGGGTDDSGESAEYYYRANGKLFFSFIKYANVRDCLSEIRSYYDKSGELIKRSYRDGKKCSMRLDIYPFRIDNPKRGYKNFCYGE